MGIKEDIEKYKKLKAAVYESADAVYSANSEAKRLKAKWDKEISELDEFTKELMARGVYSEVLNGL